MGIFKIAVTGSAGSGKSLVCKRFGKLGLTVYDCDQIARDVVEPGKDAYNALVNFFGDSIVSKDDTLDRARLRELLVSKHEFRKKMESIIHPAIMKELFDNIKNNEKNNEKAVVVEVPLLFESNLEDRFDKSITVAVAKNVLVKRIVARDNVSLEQARKMVAIQMDLDEKIKRSDYIIENTQSIDDLYRSVDKLYKQLIKEFLT